jgi:hypothetical protein
MPNWIKWATKNQWRIFFVAGLLVLLSIPLKGFLSWSARVGHNQSGEVLHALTIDISQYTQDNQGRLPPMKNYADFKAAVWPYAKSDALFRAYDNSTHLFLPNPNLSQKKVMGVTKLTVLLYESEPSKADNSRWVAFLPESVLPSAFGGDPDFIRLKQVKEADWQRLKVANGIP